MAKKALSGPQALGLLCGAAGLAIGGVVTWVVSRRKAVEREAAEDAARKRRKAILDARRSRIYDTYPPDLARQIDAGHYWVGMEASQLEDALGAPVDVDEQVLKTKTKQVWKYNKTGENRYGLRITLDDGIVKGWDKKE